MGTLAAERRAQGDAARERVAGRAAERRRHGEILHTDGGLALADEPARVATRIDRLRRYHPDLPYVDAAAVVAEEPRAIERAAVVLERVINEADFLRVAYLEAGVAAEHAVARVAVRDPRGRLEGYGTGSLVSPLLLLTNHHVLPDRATAASSVAEFDYEDAPDGRPRLVRSFRFDPDVFFLADRRLDFALVALRASRSELAEFGFNRLMPEEGKAIIGDYVTIVQHPGGEKKQVVLRENRVVDLLDVFMHYSADTAPGSSGAPVFNDDLEMVALHHASVEAPEQPDLGGFVNEGVRVSRLVEFIRERDLGPAQRRLVDEMLSEPAAATDVGAAPPLEDAHPRSDVAARADGVDAPPVEVPIDVVVRVRNAVASVDGREEGIDIDPDYSTREGYDPRFLGGGELEIPLPTLPPDLFRVAAVDPDAPRRSRHVLDYHHYSVIHNAQRRLAFVTAVNVDGATHFRDDLPRGDDKWSFDPRIPRAQQCGEDVYAANPLDRGHLVRRLDPGWGESLAFAKLATDDTYHFTNCTPQHEDFNQNRATWAGLEDYILYNADNHDFRANVYTGPVFADDDDEYRGVALPRQFWKVAAMVKHDGTLSATGYLLSQEALLDDLEIMLEAFSYSAYKTFQVPVRRIEELTRLDFGRLADADPLARMEAAIAHREITRPQEIIL